MSVPSLPFSGGCYCGAIRYEIGAAPHAIIICHCRDCQRLTGSAFSMPMVVSRAAFSLGGCTKSFKRTADNGNESTQHFCAECGTRIYTEAANPELITVRAGTLDDTSWVRPVAQVWTSSAQPWACVDDLLSFPSQPDDPAPILRAWRNAQECTGGSRS